MHRLKESNAQGNIKLCSFDITNMYPNIPQKEFIQVIDNALQNNSVKTKQKKSNKTQQPPIQTRTWLGAPTSALFAEIFMQYIEHNHIIRTLTKHNILDYHRMLKAY
jgi:hypothetical protein